MAERSGLRRAVNGIARRGAAGPPSANAVAEQTAVAAGTPVSGSTERATSRGCAQPAQRPSRPERASNATPGSRVIAPQSGQTIAIGKGPADIRGSERMTSPLRFRERSPFANRIPLDSADFGGFLGAARVAMPARIRLRSGKSCIASECESPGVAGARGRPARGKYDRSA
jgi:hypothetical protein